VIAEGAVVRDSVILTGAMIEAGAVVDRCILDSGVRIGAEALVGHGEDNTPNQQAPDLLNTGLTVIGRNAEVPARARVGRNVVIRPRVGASAFGADQSVASGQTVS
jgi:glucose-1-phosphate adenylyltransferase